MEVRAKKALGQHFLTDQAVARRIVDALSICDTAEPTIPLHPQGTGERIPPEPPSVASLRRNEDVGRLYGDGVSSPDRLRPRSREWEGPYFAREKVSSRRGRSEGSAAPGPYSVAQ